jgi:hypothetical protein
MKKIKNSLLIIFVVLLLSGCDLNYNLIINKDLSSEEKITFNVKKIALDEIKDKYGNEYVDELKEYYKPILENQNYTYKYNDDSDITLNVGRKNNSVIFNDKIIKARYNYFDYSCNLSNCIIYAIADDNVLSYDGCVYDLTLNIQVPYRALENNADKVDKQSNTYTWYSKAGKDNSDIILVFKKEGADIILINKIFYFIKIGIFAIISLTIIFALVKLVIKLNRNSKPML